MELTRSAQLFDFDRGTNTVYLGQTKEGSYIYSGQAYKEFAIGEVPNGGYVLSVLFDAVLRLYSERYQVDPIALNAFFLRKTEIKGVVIEIQDVKKTGKGYCVTKAVLKQHKTNAGQIHTLTDYHPQDYVDKVLGIFTMGNMNNEQGVSATHDDRPQPPNEQDLREFDFTFMRDLVEMTADSQPDPNQVLPMEVHQTSRFKDQRPIDAKSMPFWCDMFLSPPNMLGPQVFGENNRLWCATMQMEIQFKQKCPVGLQKVLSSFVTHTLKNSRFDIDGWIWDEQGELLATTRHQCLCLPWERNTPSSKL
ncbi:thioesterase-like superfamily-domain-containing protein [Chlamydoabsidia padenii]|nr:thioesterase-like superfamily-domain-containing protein [Chlamydoabsidia padenii]